MKIKRRANTETYEDLKNILEYILETTVNFEDALSRIETVNVNEVIGFKKHVYKVYEQECRVLTMGRLLTALKYWWFRKPSVMKGMIDSFIKYNSSIPGGIPGKRMCGVRRGE